MALLESVCCSAWCPIVNSYGLCFQVFGVDSYRGHILWRHLLTDIIPFQSYSEKRLLLFMQRTTAHFPLEPQASIIGQHRVSISRRMGIFGKSLSFSLERTNDRLHVWLLKYHRSLGIYGTKIKTRSYRRNTEMCECTNIQCFVFIISIYCTKINGIPAKISVI